MGLPVAGLPCENYVLSCVGNDSSVAGFKLLPACLSSQGEWPEVWLKIFQMPQAEVSPVLEAVSVDGALICYSSKVPDCLVLFTNLNKRGMMDYLRYVFLFSNHHRNVILSEVARAFCELRSRRTPKPHTSPMLFAPFPPRNSPLEIPRLKRSEQYRQDELFGVLRLRSG